MAEVASSILTTAWVPTPSDGQTNETLNLQYETEHDISTILTSCSPLIPPVLDRQAHSSFSLWMASNTLPAGFAALDASRPWLLYWTLHSLALMSTTTEPSLYTRAIRTLDSCQNSVGGFGGGPGQQSHLAPSYAAVCTLCVIGNEDGWDIVNREGMYTFLMKCKQKDGSFVMHEGGEVDVRGTYCALVIATLLNLMTPELVENTAQFVASCQTYEGGLASSAFPSSATSPDSLSQPLGEAHGGYAFCAAASAALLRPFRHLATEGRQLDLDALVRWSVSMQAVPIEGGGFRGRTNKLVDGCYGWWNGGLFGVLGALVGDDNDDGGMHDVFDRVALQEYILYLAQSPQGGLRDKPGKGVDAYHTCYNLSGLSASQIPQIPDVDRAREEWQDVRVWEAGKGAIREEGEAAMKEVWSYAVGWREGDKIVVGEEENELLATHPLFNVPLGRARAMLAYFYGQTAPPPS